MLKTCDQRTLDQFASLPVPTKQQLILAKALRHLNRRSQQKPDCTRTQASLSSERSEPEKYLATNKSTIRDRNRVKSVINECNYYKEQTKIDKKELELTIKEYSDYMGRFHNHVGSTLCQPSSTIDPIFAQDLNRKFRSESQAGKIKEEYSRSLKKQRVRPEKLASTEVSDRLKVPRKT